jgi:hypothetical protein
MSSLAWTCRARRARMGVLWSSSPCQGDPKRRSGSCGARRLSKLPLDCVRLARRRSAGGTGDEGCCSRGQSSGTVWDASGRAHSCAN